MREDTLAPSHLRLAVREAGAVADDAELRKTQKYSNLTSSHYFVLLAVESLGVFGKEARSFLKELGVRVNCHPATLWHNIWCSESQWLYKEGMLLQCWGALG